MNYTDEKHILILISLLKKHGIRKIVASPGTTNLTFVGSVQCDPFFQVYSSVDERSACYMACGLAEESGEPVVLSCTGATASRNYVPGLTEAFYSKIPILAVTSMQYPGKIGHNMPQVIDRSIQMKDITLMSKEIRAIHSDIEEWDVTVSINDALLELKHHGGGPVHLNVETTYSRNYSVNALPDVRKIERICYDQIMPEIPKDSKTVIFVGAHKRWNTKQIEAIDSFCEKYDATVLCDVTSNYFGKFRVNPHLLCSQLQYYSPIRNVDLLIHIGNITGSDINVNPKEVWRVNPDGVLRDTYGKLRYVFEMEEESFFEKYSSKVVSEQTLHNYHSIWGEECREINNKIPELPFSNAWLAQNTLDKIPNNSTIYFSVLNTLRCWNYFYRHEPFTGYSNTGGFGIDGGLSTFIGSSLVNNNSLCFCVIGDLSFFYDMNVLGNRHIKSNIRILLVNNGRGTEFTNYNHPGYMFGEDAKPYIAAAGHFGNQSKSLVKHYSEDLGFRYLSARNKEEYLRCVDEFVNEKIVDRPILLEVFTNGEEESDAVKMLQHILVSSSLAKKQSIMNVIGENNYNTIKKLLGR